ncbi:MAG: hypothetical protein GF341_00345 [candidate division Zixibacteria bacterium]|nr:hypothetical protein [candidate division Zixibacteria bacterium]
MGADVGGGAEKPQKGKKGLRRPKRRISIRLDMTPMVDIAFLLLIFYMVSTVFAEPQAMEINLPPSEEEAPAAESKILILRVAEDDQIYWNIGDQEPTPISLEALPKLLQDKVYEVPGLITLIKINKGARYERMVQILDRIEVVEYRMRQAQKQAIERGERAPTEEEFSYTFSLGPWTRLDTRLISEVTGSEETEDTEGS